MENYVSEQTTITTCQSEDELSVNKPVCIASADFTAKLMSLIKQLTERLERLETAKKPMQISRQSGPTDRRQPSGHQVARGTYWNCSEQGHFVRDCSQCQPSCQSKITTLGTNSHVSMSEWHKAYDNTAVVTPVFPAGR